MNGSVSVCRFGSQESDFTVTAKRSELSFIDAEQYKLLFLKCKEFFTYPNKNIYEKKTPLLKKEGWREATGWLVHV